MTTPTLAGKPPMMKLIPVLLLAALAAACTANSWEVGGTPPGEPPSGGGDGGDGGSGGGAEGVVGYPLPAAPADRFVGFIDRTELAEAGDRASVQRALRFSHITDLQLVDDDAPFPLRQGLLDEVYAATISSGGERPQEEFADEIMASLVTVLNRQHGFDPLEFAVHTGDNIDNALENEALRYLDLLKGRNTTVGPISGLSCNPDGQSANTEDFLNDETLNCTSIPAELVDQLTGLNPEIPSFIAAGNHDLLIQGNVAIEPSFQELAGLFGRHLLHTDEFLRLHFDDLTPCNGGSAADDFGHGFGYADEARRCDAEVENDAYYAFLSGGMLHVVLDTVNDDIFQINDNSTFVPTETATGHDIVSGLSEGALDLTQWAWLQGLLEDHADKLVVLYSHHTINSFYSDVFDPLCGPPGCLNDILTAAGFLGRDEVRARLDAYPNLVAWVGGHTHQHRITAVTSETSSGFWNIETSGMLDLPQESRIVEFWVNPATRKGFIALDPITHEFETAREVAATDGQHDATTAAGGAGDRRVLLWFDVPEGIDLPAAGGAGPQPVSR